MITRVFTGELLRFVKRLASLIALGALALVVALDFASYPATVARLPKGFPQTDVWTLVVTKGAGFTAVIACMMIVLMVAGEFEWRTARQNLIDGLSRNQWVAGKVLLVVFMAVFFQLFKAVIAVVMMVMVVKEPQLQQAAFGAQQVQEMAGVLTATLLACGIGLWIALLVRSAGTAIGLTVLAAMLDGVVSTVFDRYDLKEWAEYLPLQLILSLDNERLYQQVNEFAPAFLQWKGPNLQQLLLGAWGWIAVLLLSAWALFRRRDI